MLPQSGEGADGILKSQSLEIESAIRHASSGVRSATT